MRTFRQRLSDIITLGGRLPKPIGGLGLWLYGHRNAVGRGWEVVGRWQFKFMRSRGLKSHHVFLDIGCGSLRGGRFFIPFLQPGHYLGIERQKVLVDAGVQNELDPHILKAKKPQFVISDQFEFAKLSQIPDYSLAQSVFTHLNQQDIEICLRNLRAHVKEGHLLYANFFEVPTAKENKTESHPNVCFYYTREEIVNVAETLGWSCEYIGDWDRTRPHKMIQFKAV